MNFVGRSLYFADFDHVNAYSRPTAGLPLEYFRRVIVILFPPNGRYTGLIIPSRIAATSPRIFKTMPSTNLMLY